MRRAGMLAVLTTVAAWAGGCGSNEPAAPFAATDPAGALFAPDHVVEVAIDMAPEDWDRMRRQTRDWWDVAAADQARCLLEPFRKPFEWFEATVTVDGVRRERVAVRKKGFIGSLDDARPALKLHYDRFVPGQSLHGLERLTLNNSFQDPTWLKQCLAYGIYGRAGIPVPWCNFAHVTANGRDLGLYVNVESMDRRFVRRHFERDEGELWEGEVSDFSTLFLSTFELKGVSDEEQTSVDRSSLEEVARAVAPNLGYPTMREQLDAAIDFDEFMRFWAVEKVVEHWDGYSNGANNFLIYHNPADGRFVFMPTGLDQIAVVDPYDEVLPPVSVYAEGAIANRLYADAETRQLYVDKLRFVLDNVFDEQSLLAEIDRLQAIAAPVLARTGADLAEQAQAVEELRSFVRGRRAVLLADIQNGPREWRQARKTSICVDLAGEVEGSFATSWGTNSAPDIFRTGNGTFSGLYRRVPISAPRVGAWAGLDRNAQAPPPWPVIDMNAVASSGVRYDIWIGVKPEEFRPGTSGPFDGKYAWGGLGNWNPTTRQWTYMGGFVGGELRLEQAGLSAGAPVSGSFRGRVIRWQ